MTRRRVAILTAIVVVVLVAGVCSVAYRTAYGVWWSEPDRFEYCDRTYHRGTGDPLTLEAVRAKTSQTALPGDAPSPLQRVATVPPLVGAQVLAAVTPEQRRRELHVPCAMVAFRQIGEDSYRVYVISGGP